MLRIGILLDGLTIQAWQAETLRQILNSGEAEIPVLVINQSPKPSGKSSPLLYRAYRKLDRLLFKSKVDAFKSVDLLTILPSNTHTISCQPIQKKFRDRFLEADLEKIAGYQLDILIRFGFRILSGRILTLPRLGVWSYHHGDPGAYRGGPPAFWEVMNQIPSTGCVLMRINENLDQGEVLYQTRTQTDPLSVQRNANRVFWMSASIPARVLHEIHRVGLEVWEKNKIQSKAIPIVPILKPPGPLKMFFLGINLAVRNLKRKVREATKLPHWEIGWVEDLTYSNQLISIQEVSFISPPNSHRDYLADPFPVRNQGKTWIFVEQFDKKKKKGQISVLDEEGRVKPVLEEPWHLSYPFVWEENGSFWMIPEAAEAGKLWIYQALDFPFRWEKIKVFFPEEAYDPTLWKTEEGYWLFVNQKSHPECSPFDELYLYFSPSFIDPDWMPHPQNPIVSDVSCARPAGRLWFENGKLYRPAQDSELRYGHRIKVMEIRDLSLTHYKEVEAFRIEPNEREGKLGIHTLNRMGSRWILDFYSRK